MDLDPYRTEMSELVRQLDTDLERGLSRQDAARRLAVDGPNEIQAAPPVPTWRKILAQFQDPLIYLLLVAVMVSVAAWLAEGADGVPVDGIVIGSIVILNALLGFVQEKRAENAVAALKQLTAATATVVRDGEQIRVPAAEVVRG
ncbi:MAG TPA: cation-transporting P-type ATPase, partial [Micromonosporaceae bacterium]|nr:cation-transporting P-type ATPase [Micromonosporaceae bacterium]